MAGQEHMWPADKVERRPVERLIQYARNACQNFSIMHRHARLRQRSAIHSGCGQAEMAQHGWGDVDQGGAGVAGAGDEAAARDEEERALLVFAEPAMLAEAGGVFGLERVALDVAVAGHAVRIGAVVGFEGHRNLHRGIRR